MNSAPIMRFGRFALSFLWLFATGTFEGECAEAAAPIHAVDGTYAKDWLVLGPFASQDSNTDHLASDAGVAKVRPKEGDTVSGADGKRLTWKRYTSAEDFVNLSAAVGSSNNSTAYAYGELESAVEGDAVFQMLTHGQPRSG